MKLGLIGYPLGHSKSPQIHKILTGAEYSLWPIKKEELDGFFLKKDFDGLNVTIPYKRDVIKFLDFVHPDAEKIGAVNTIVNKSGKLYGYNTDALGMEILLKDLSEESRTSFENKTAAVLGSGGAARACAAAVKSLGGKPVIISRNPKEASKDLKGIDVAGYDELYSGKEFFAVINATPVGMSPDIEGIPADISRISGLKIAADAVANPLRTRLIYEAQNIGLKTAGGLKMLVAQALAAEELFTGSTLSKNIIDPCVKKIAALSRNIVIIGMPSSGKTTIGKLLAKMTGLPFTDMDAELEKRFGISISEYFSKYGEPSFRSEEAKLAAELSAKEGMIISTGGGAVKDPQNMRRLSANGTIIWLDRSLELLCGSEDRPLSKNADDIRRLYDQRRDLYRQYSDVKIKADGTPQELAEKIIRSIS